MKATARRRLPPDALVAVIMTALVLPMWVPTAFKLLGRNVGFLRNLGFGSGPSGTPLAWVLALAVAMIFSFFAVINIPSVNRTWRQPSWLKGLAFVAAIAAATVEEAFFRRSVMDALMRMGAASVLQIAGSAVSFGLPHSFFGLMRLNLKAAMRASIATGIMGGLLAVIYIVGNRSLAPCITAHFLITFALEPGLLLAAVKGEWRPQSIQAG